VVEPQANKNIDSSEGIEDEADAMLLSEQELGATNKNTSSRDANIPDSNRRSQRERKQTVFLTVGKETRPSYRDDPQSTEDDRSDTISSLEASSHKFGDSVYPSCSSRSVDRESGYSCYGTYPKEGHDLHATAWSELPPVAATVKEKRLLRVMRRKPLASKAVATNAKGCAFR